MSSLTFEVPQELFAPAESSSFGGEYALPKLQAGPDTYRFAEPLRWDVTLTNTGGALLVTGTVRGTGETACARCLDEFRIDVCGDVEGYFVIGGGTRPEDLEEDEFEFLGEDDVIDLEPLIVAAVLVDLPLLPLCRDDCQGICPDCGTNLNRGQCGCATERAERDARDAAAANPFAALSQVRFDEE